MIFIIIFVVILLFVMALNIYDSSNIESIEKHLKNSKCESLIYSKGRYKALCKDGIKEVKNSFTVDFEENSRYYEYKKIKKIEKKKLNIIINDKDKIEFKTEKNLDKFYNSLEKKVK